MPARQWRLRLGQATLHNEATTFACSPSSSLEIIGEAANSVPVETQAQFPDIAFQQAIAMRHRLIHGYNRIKISIVEATAQDDLPGLIASLERALDGALPGD